MKRLSRDRGRQTAARIAEQDGFTLIELLVTMVVGIVVLGAGTYGLALAFRQNHSISGRTAAVSQGEVGIQRLTDDLRNAVNGSCGTLATPISVSQPQANVYDLAMCEPTGNPASGGVTTGLGSQPVAWTCNATTGSLKASGMYPAAGPWTCQRSVNSSPAQSFHGVEGLSLTGLLTIVGGTPQTLPYQPASTAYNQYTLNTANSGMGASSVYSVSWIGIYAQIAALTQETGTTTIQATTAVPVQTGVQLRNFGTT